MFTGIEILNVNYFKKEDRKLQTKKRVFKGILP